MTRPYDRKRFDQEVRNMKRAIERSERSKYPIEYCRSRFLNNFQGHFPGGMYRSYRAYRLAGLSKRYLGRLKNLHRAIDSELRKLGLIKNPPKWILERTLAKGKDLENVIGVYVSMRRRGFKHYPTLIG